MTRKPPRDDVSDDGMIVSPPKRSAVGIPGITHAVQQATAEMGVRPFAAHLAEGQPDGRLRLPGLRLARGRSTGTPRSSARTAPRRSPRRPPSAGSPPTSSPSTRSPTCAERSDYWLGQQGRLTEPMHQAAGADHYQPISLGRRVRADRRRAARRWTRPTRRVFYTSGRTSNEAAFLYQLFVRMLGTNNLPDCSNMCHESSGSALTETIGVGKGTVSLEDFDQADLIFVVGQNPGTNHPRMLSALEKAKRGGRHDHRGQPAARGRAAALQEPADGRPGCSGGGTQLADLFLQIRRQRRPRAVPGAEPRCCWRRRRPRRAPCSTATSSTSTPPASTTSPRDAAHARLGRRRDGDRPGRAADRATLARGARRRSGSSSAGRWA